MLLGYALADHVISERSVLNATEPLGLAFQIQDDIISTFGDPKKTGKTIDADLKEGKITLLAWEAVRRMPNTQSKIVWERTFGNPKATKKELDELRKIIKNTGALTYVETLEEQLIDHAIEHAKALPKCGTWFVDLANALRHRTK
jgi:geranylgeranyl pyrophosphate synthase